MGTGEKRRHEQGNGITYKSSKKARKQKAWPGTSGGPGQSGLALCLTALDHCIEQMPLINSQETLEAIAVKANTLLKAVQARLQSVATDPSQQDQQQLNQECQLKHSDTQKVRAPCRPVGSHTCGWLGGKQLQQQHNTQPLQVVEDKRPFVFTTTTAAVSEPAAVAGNFGVAGPAANAGSRHGKHVEPSHILSSPKENASLQAHSTKQQQRQQNHGTQPQQQPHQISGARALLQRHILAAQTGRSIPTAAPAKQTINSNTSPTSGSRRSGSKSSAANSNKSDSSSDRDGSSSSSSNSSDRSSSNADSSTSDDSRSSSDHSSHSSGSSSNNSSSSSSTSSSSGNTSSDDSSSSSGSDTTSGDDGGTEACQGARSSGGGNSSYYPLADAGGTMSARPGNRQLQAQQQDQLHQCLVCRRMVETPDLFANRLVITCKVCVAGAVAGAVSRLSHCPKRGCGATDIKLGQVGFHQGNKGLQHYVSVSALKGFSIHYVKRKLSKKQAAAVKALQAAGRKALLGSPAERRSGKKRQKNT